ncbi:TPA: hypothetical protein NDY80_003619 [Pseudomonas aeruginosa]|uniref:hypothetical protein n=1 Tax=Pseudomonas aeruginosa TaxID=287 RepID=UPI000F538E19|nr:hypothetical protein [Pseudomonas aeruginosa]RQC50300.1 hypothetical protein IPC358_30575 [Pseudomonas aeruginosa]HCD6679566.1 hypothetical protein [Pseudomonas aeruginosa]HCD6685210.1 hypothetical protein [Pseudomonas aeruginosa]HCD7191428.1 hypothetical protein [Pseudomonas aeruginosa]
MTTPSAVTGAGLRLTERVDQALQQYRLGLITAQERQAQIDKAFAIYRAGVNARDDAQGEPPAPT